MATVDQRKACDRSTPEAAVSKVLAQSYTSSVEWVEDGEVTLMEMCCASAASLPPRENTQVPILYNIILERYEGDKCGGLFHGEGVACFQGGHVYKGGFSHGLMHGRGEYVWSDGVKYEGDFKSNVPMGHGTYTWLDGSTYEGEVHTGVRHGAGTYTCAKTSTVYRGQWCLGKRQGKGIMYYNREGTTWYKGDWVNNCREGWGERRYPSGNVYEGQWSNNVRHGEGTMKWVQLNQQYSGQWVNGIQDGKGTHTWFRKRIPCSQYPCMNEYTGEYVQGMRHGTGQFLYASGAVYCGEWSHDKKHGQGKYTSENGRIFEGEFVRDSMVEFPAFTPGLSAPSTPYPDDSDSPERFIQKSTNSSLLGSDMALNIQTLLNRVPEAHRDQELKQVEFAVLRHIGLLREIYSFYSSLGHEQTPDKTFPLTHLQFSRLLKDCKVHQHGITPAQIDRLINDIQQDGVCSPFTTILPRECVSYIIIAAHHICHKDIECSNNLLASCFSKLMRQNIIPNAKNVKGLLFRHPVVACNYTDRCWNIYQALCKAYSVHTHQTLTVRQFIWMLKDLCLYDNELTASKVLEIVSAENPAIYDGTHSNLQLEMTFLEFFEALLGCAEVKGKRIQTLANQSNVDHQEDTNESRIKSSLLGISSCAVSTNAPEMVPSYEMAHSSTCKKMEQRQYPIASKEAAEGTGGEAEMEGWIQKTQQFLTQTFFPAYEHSMKVKEVVKDERLKQMEKNRIFLAEEKSRQQCEAEEVESRGSVSDSDLSHPPPPATTPVTSTNSIVSEHSPISGREKRSKVIG